MEARELRIDNIINHITGPIVVDVDDLKLIKNDPCEYMGEILTEQWLLDFGFSYNDFSFELDNLSIDSEDRLIIVDRIGYGIVIARNVMYVHQLQNLYFALTGNELKLKYNEKGKY